MGLEWVSCSCKPDVWLCKLCWWEAGNWPSGRLISGSVRGVNNRLGSSSFTWSGVKRSRSDPSRHWADEASSSSSPRGESSRAECSGAGGVECSEDVFDEEVREAYNISSERWWEVGARGVGARLLAEYDVAIWWVGSYNDLNWEGKEGFRSSTTDNGVSLLLSLWGAIRINVGGWEHGAVEGWGWRVTVWWCCCCTTRLVVVVVVWRWRPPGMIWVPDAVDDVDDGEGVVADEVVEELAAR